MRVHPTCCWGPATPLMAEGWKRGMYQIRCCRRGGGAPNVDNTRGRKRLRCRIVECLGLDEEYPSQKVVRPLHDWEYPSRFVIHARLVGTLPRRKGLFLPNLRHTSHNTPYRAPDAVAETAIGVLPCALPLSSTWPPSHHLRRTARHPAHSGCTCEERPTSKACPSCSATAWTFC